MGRETGAGGAIAYCDSGILLKQNSVEDALCRLRGGRLFVAAGCAAVLKAAPSGLNWFAVLVVP